MYWCRTYDKCIFHPGFSVLTEEDKKAGAGRASRKSDGGRVPVGAEPQTWGCFIDGKWQDWALTVRRLASAEERSALERECEAAQAAAEAAQQAAARRQALGRARARLRVRG